ncbi:MinD/ParA family protein [Cellulosilyticum sp. I15G10I2]|uniref:MinD/ParA family protein n=1 Tax=Cellulosilyticum sp. I15G10I2 TaxID=1892843 RepID=UPI00085BB0FA|nr:MinD/ParA family protein [Cellulosilyticum sp. I15G10I2]
MNDQAEQLRKIVSSTKPAEDKTSNMKVITIASGKGGVGKSNFTVNLALCLKQLHKNPVILDADFGLANVEIILGERPKFNLAHLIREECGLKDLMTKSKYEISFISGGSGINEMMFLPSDKIETIGKSLIQLEDMTDTLLIDTGAGINDIVLKFCMLAHEVYIVVTPEPTSITDGYALIKTLKSDFTMQSKIKIVINKATSKEEAHEVFTKLHYVSKNFLKTEIEYVGYIPYDEKVLSAVKSQIPVVIYDKKSKASAAYYQISKSIISDNISDNTPREKASWITKFKRIFTN